MNAAHQTPRSSWADLAAAGAVIEIAPGGAVTVRAPAGVAATLRAELAWRVDAMRAQLRNHAGRVGGSPPTAVALPGLEIPFAPVVRWRGLVDVGGRRVFLEREARRPVAGRCGSCGDTLPGETGHCPLCNAARVGALRAEGLLPVSTWTPPPPRDVDAWRAGLRAEVARPDPLPPPSRRVPWTCDVCGAGNVGRRDVEGCGRCELRAADVMSTARLGGGK